MTRSHYRRTLTGCVCGALLDNIPTFLADMVQVNTRAEQMSERKGRHLPNSVFGVFCVTGILASICCPLTVC